MELSWLDLLILGMATHRLWLLWFYSKFTEQLRLRMGQRGGWIGYFAGCQLCVSVWAGIGAVTLWSVPYGSVVCVALAIGGAVFFLQPIQSVLEASVQRKNAEIERIKAEVEAWNKPKRG